MADRKYALQQRSYSLSSQDSLEDIIVELYKQSLNDGQYFKEKKKKKPKRTGSPSPYQQKVAPGNMSTLLKPSQRRPATAKPGRQRAWNSINESVHTSEKSDNDEKMKEDDYSSSFSSDSDSDSSASDKQSKNIKSKFDEDTYPSNTEKKKMRPKSAIQRRREEEEPLTPSHDLSKPLYKRQPYTITCFAFKNGSFEEPVRLAAPTVKQLLEDATLKLGLNGAARRVFLSNGCEVFRPRDVPRDADVYISKGEPFKNPYRALKLGNDLRSESTQSFRKAHGRQIKPPGAKRLKELVGKHTKRVIVFHNGDGKESHEVVLNPQDKESRFLDDCTLRLRLASAARVLYDWKGKPVADLSQVDKIDHDIFKASSVVYGPLWVSRNEGFSPTGALYYIQSVVTYLRLKLDSAKLCKKDVELVKQKRYNEVSNQEALGLDEEAIYLTLEKIEEDIESFKAQLTKYKAKLKKLEQRVERQENEGHEYVMKHIKKIESDDRLLGMHGLRITIFENGKDQNSQNVFINMRDIQRGLDASKDATLIRSRFLEALTAWHKPIDPTGPARSTMVKRIFDENGKEIDNVGEIASDDKLWLSYGEDFKPSSTPMLTVQVERVSAVQVQTEDGTVTKVFHEMLDPQSDLPKGAERASQWEVHDCFPSLYDARSLTELTPMRKYEIQVALERKSFSTDDHYVLNKKDKNLVIFPTVQIDNKLSKQLAVWPREPQTWLINQSGQIYSRAFPALALSLDVNRPITVHFRDGSIHSGFAVLLRKRQAGSSSQQWGFTAGGNIHTLHGISPQQVLTCLHKDQVSKVVELSDNEEFGNPASTAAEGTKIIGSSDDELTVTVIVCEKFPAQSGRSRCQTWAIKQESLVTPSQWKHTQVANPEWKKRALSWPVLPDGNWNKKYYWPMEGSLLSNIAPPDRGNRKSSTEEIKKVRVYRNGEKNKNRFVYLVAPSLSSMEKENKAKAQKKKRRSVVQEACGQRGQNQILKTADEEQDAKKQLEEPEMTPEQVEMMMFLERATSLLNIGFAARRLFDESGKELLSLRALKRDQAVFVSSGEPWVDPRMTKIEHQRRHLLTQLNNDVAMIRAFCTLRNPQDFVLHLENGARLGSRLVLKTCSLNKEERATKAKGELDKSTDADKASSESSSDSSSVGDPRSAHERSHMNSDKKMVSKKYPWQQDLSQDEALNSVAQVASENAMDTPRSSRLDGSTKRNPRGISSQKFVFKDGFISPLSDPTLAVGVVGLDLDNMSPNVDVTLCKKSSDDPVQQWELTEEGFIRLKYSPRLVLGVSLPPYKPGSGGNLSLEHSVATVQSAGQHENGRAHQKWLWDPVSYFLFPFHSDTSDKETTAANHVAICTCAVSGAEALNQDGYIVHVNGASPSDPVVVCRACAKILRGIYQLSKAPEEWSFTCAMSSARKYGMKSRGTFAFLNGKVDLSTYEADTTLNHWSLQLEKLHQETSMRSLNRELHTTVPIQACRVLAMRNGEGRMKPGELVIGSSISGIMEQCTQRLSLGTAARRLYTSDGMHILHLEQLLQWATDNFYKLQQQQMQWFDPNNRDLIYGRGEPEGHPPTPENADENNHSTEGTPDHTAAEADIKLTVSDVAKRLRPPSGRKQAKKVEKTPEKAGGDVPLSVILRCPIEVWVSCGENFIPPATAERLMRGSVKEHMKRNDDNLVLDTERHVLRHMQGRRFKDMNPRELKPTRSPQQPILLEGGWQEATKFEATKQERVHKLEEHLAEQRPVQSVPRTKGINFNKELYRQSNRKRVLVHQKGESVRRAQYVWGETLSEILADATERLNMPRAAKLLYDEDGSKITDFEQIERDALLCVTSGEKLKGRPKQSNMQMKANWAKVRKEKGPSATDIRVTPSLADPTRIGVDPFGPSGLASEPTRRGIAWEVDSD